MCIGESNRPLVIEDFKDTDLMIQGNHKGFDRKIANDIGAIISRMWQHQ